MPSWRSLWKAMRSSSKKYRPTGSCDFCGEVDDNAIQYAGYCICTSCRKKIGSMKK